MTTPSNFRALCATIVVLWDADCDIDVEINELRELLATPPPLAPDYIDPEHHGEDRELLQVFYAACNAEGGTADEIHLRGIRAVMAACPALATPPPVPPSEKEIELFVESIRMPWILEQVSRATDPDPDFDVVIVRAALERWGR